MKKSRTFASAIEKQPSKLQNAQMAESVDALVSNTSGFTSIPVRPRVWVQEKEKVRKAFSFFCCVSFLCFFLFRSRFSLHFHIINIMILHKNAVYNARENA